ncbi:MAG: thermonuclease family protein [Nitrospira sp.]|nr:thermonuclease family protein [Nitrospira sp.]
MPKLNQLALTGFWLSVLLMLLGSFPSLALAQSFSGQVVSILDGDTIDVLHNGQVERIRLNGIDAPERDQDYGQQAKQLAEELAHGQQVAIETKEQDRYGRTVGDVFLPDGRNLNKELVSAGLAWWYCEHSSDQTLKDLEQDARDKKRGLWSDRVPIPPWVYRKIQRNQVPRVADYDCPPATQPQNVGQNTSSGTTTAIPFAGPVIANKRSRVYHRPDCPAYDRVSPSNRVQFPSGKAAEDAGYRLAGNCP